jgi:hypothetical protein
MDKEINMKKDPNTKTNINIVKKLVIFTELLVLFLVIGSSIAMAYAGFSEENKSISIPAEHKFIHTDITKKICKCWTCTRKS